MGNAFKTALLLTVLTLLLLFLGRAFGGQQGMLIALIFAAVMNFVSYFFSDKIALAMYRAQPVTREDLPRVYGVVERLTQRVGIPMPKIYVIPTDSPNAFEPIPPTSGPLPGLSAALLFRTRTCARRRASALPFRR